MSDMMPRVSPAAFKAMSAAAPTSPAAPAAPAPAGPVDSAVISGNTPAPGAPVASTSASPTPVPAAPSPSAPAAGSAAPAPGTTVPPGYDIGKVFEKNPLGPYKPEDVCSWKYEAKDKHSIDEIVRTSDGRVFLTAHSFDTSARGKAPRGYTVAFDPQGNPAWEYAPSGKGEKNQEIHSTLYMPDGSAVVVTRSNERWDPAFLISFGPDGKERWRVKTESDEKIDSVLPGPNGNLYAKAGRNVYCYDAQGKEVWKHELPINPDEFFHVVGPDGSQLFVNDNFSMNFGYDSWYSVDASGKGDYKDLPDIGTFPLELGNTLVFGGEHGELNGIDLAGGANWQIQTDSERGLKTPFLGADGNVYVEGRFDKKLYAVSPSGQKLWQATIEDTAPTGMALDSPFHVDKDGSVYYVKDGGDSIQRIMPDGRMGPVIAVPEGIDSFQPGGDGRLYAWSTGESSIVTMDVQTGKRVCALPLDIEHPNVFDLREVLPGGIAVLKSMDTLYNIRADQNPALDQALEDLKNAPAAPAPPPPVIEKQDEYVVIGGVRVPIRKKID